MARIVYHDGKNIPELDPKDPDSDTWYGIEYTLDDGEFITADSWLIDGEPVTTGVIVKGLEFVSGARNGVYTKVNLKGGIEGTRYLITNRFSTNQVPSDDRSFYLPCEKL